MPTLTDEQLAALRAWREAGGYCDADRLNDAVLVDATHAIDAILAANPAPELPWEPSEQAIEDYIEAYKAAAAAWKPNESDWAVRCLRNAHEDGWDIRPRRLVQEWTDEQAAAFWRLAIGQWERMHGDADLGERALARLRAAGYTITPPEEAT